MFRTAQGIFYIEAAHFILHQIPKVPELSRMKRRLNSRVRSHHAWVLTPLLTYFDKRIKWNWRDLLTRVFWINKDTNLSLPNKLQTQTKKTFWKWEDHELYLLLLLERNKCSFQSNFVEDTFLPPTWLIDILLTISQSFVTVPESS